MTPGPKGDKRSEVFGKAKLNLAKYASATTGKRVVLTITPEGSAVQDKGRNITVVITVAAESSHSGTEMAALDAKSAADRALAGTICCGVRACPLRVHLRCASCTATGDDSEDESPSPSPFKSGGGSSDEEEEPATPRAVAPAAGVKSLPAPPPPTQLVAKKVEWRGVGAGTVRETQRLFALCCPCLQKNDQFQPLQ
jgi:hypothetical protein